MLAPVHMSIADMQAAARDGAYIEFVYNGLTGAGKEFEVADYVKAIRAVGVEHCILASDLGQAGNPVHPEGLEEFFRALRVTGISEADIEVMAKRNPARALGIAELARP
jgi:microsomal dipeptidase-like Zn-dependent dipeptidase